MRGSPRHSKSNGGVERVNQTVQKKLGAWMKENKSKHWLIGCKIAQWRYNTQIHQTLQDGPYHLAFGQQPRVGISNLPISLELLRNLITEAELINVYSNMKSGMMTELLSGSLDPAFQDTLMTVTENINNGIAALDSTTESINNGIAAIASMTPTTMTEITPATRTKSYNTSQDRRNAKRAKTSALENAVIGNCVAESGKQDNITPAKKTSNGKTGDADLDLTSVCWIELIADHDPQKPVDLTEMKSAWIGSVFLIVLCINNKDITAMENWESCILKKVRKETWEVLNVHQNEKVEDDLELEGDDGLKNTSGLCYKNAGDEYVTLFVTATEREQFSNEKQDVSPKHASLCAKATSNVQKKAEAVTKKALTKSPTSTLKLGDIVLVPLDEVDRTKVDGGNLAGVIVSINKDKSTCWVAVKQGLLHRAYIFHSLRVVPEASNNHEVMDLEDAYIHWQGLSKITKREAAHFVSFIECQGMVKCNCKGDCTTNNCACKKAGRL